MSKNNAESFASDTSLAPAMLRAADANVMPDFTPHAVLERLGLMSDIQDELELAKRFTDSRLGLVLPIGAFSVLQYSN